MNNYSSDKLNQLVEQITWKNLLNSNDLNECVEQFLEKINEVLNILCPMKITQVRKKYIPWLSDETKLLMEERDKLRSKAAKSKSSIDFNSYKIIRNKCNRKVIEDKKE